MTIPAGHARRVSTSACAATLVLARISVVALGLPRTVRLLEGLSRPQRGAKSSNSRCGGFSDPHIISTRVTMVAAFCPGRMICLEQSLALYFLLRRRGFAPNLRIGVQPLPFQAHAWVELDGVPVNENPDYTRSLVVLGVCDE